MNGEFKKEVNGNNTVTEQDKPANNSVLDISKYSIRTTGAYLDKEER